jgi:hypothetical protein
MLHRGGVTFLAEKSSNPDRLGSNIPAAPFCAFNKIYQKNKL